MSVGEIAKPHSRRKNPSASRLSTNGIGSSSATRATLPIR